MILFARVPLALFAASLLVRAQNPDVLAIMTKATANISTATEGRRQFVYRQKIRASLIRTNGKTARKETREYTVIPQASTTEKTLVAFSGEYVLGKRMVAYTTPGLKDKGDESDRRNMQVVTEDLVSAGKSRDGIPRDLFPLSADDLKYYNFTLKTEGDLRGRKAFDIAFEPADSKEVCIQVGSAVHINVSMGSAEAAPADGGAGEGSRCRQWKGEVWIDAEDYQPIRIATRMAKGVPWGVRVFFGINVRQFGFSIDYERVAPGVWFPASYGTEFGMEVLWGYKRNITLSMENSDFRKTDASSTIHFGDESSRPQP